MADDKITIQLTITAASGAPRVPLEILKTINASELRSEASKLTKIPASSMKIIFRGRLIADDASKEAVTEYNLENGSVIHCIGKPVQEGAVTSTPSTSGAAVASASFPRIAAGTTTSATAVLGGGTAGSVDPMKAAIQTLRASNTPSIYLTAIKTLEKILGNIVDNAMEEKYRKMKKMNPAFQKRLGGIPGGDAAMKASGFTIETIDGEEQYVMKATENAWPSLVGNRNAVKAAITTATAPAFANPLSFPLTPSGGINNNNNNILGSANPLSDPNMNDAIDNWMYDPTTMQTMLQNPMFQNVIRSHPNFANNPMMQNMIQEMTNNPQLVTQMSQMMSDPTMRQQIRTMQQQSNQFGIPPMDTNTTMADAMRAMQALQQQQQAGVGTTGQPPVNMDTAMADAMRAIQQLQQIQAASGQPPIDMSVAMADAMRAVQTMQQNSGGTGGTGGAAGQFPPLDLSMFNSLPSTATGSSNPGTTGSSGTGHSTNQRQNNSTNGNDTDQTEEEMIAEAIRRSLQDS